MYFDGGSTTYSKLETTGAETGGPSEVLVQGDRYIAWFADGRTLTTVTGNASLPAVLIRELALPGTDTLSRLDFFAPPHTFSDSEINALIESHQVEIVGRETVNARTAVVLALKGWVSGDDVRVWLDSATGIRVRTQKEDPGKGTRSWTCTIESLAIEKQSVRWNLKDTVEPAHRIELVVSPIDDTGLVRVSWRDSHAGETLTREVKLRSLDAQGKLFLIVGEADQPFEFQSLEALRARARARSTQPTSIGSAESRLVEVTLGGLKAAVWVDRDAGVQYMAMGSADMQVLRQAVRGIRDGASK